MSGDKLAGLHEALKHWRVSVLRVGRELVRLQEAGEPVRLHIEQVCKRCYAMPVATANVAMRWAAGDFGDPESAEAFHVVQIMNHSVLVAWTPETIASVRKGAHTVYDPDAGHVVRLPFAQWTDRIAARNTSRAGIIPINEDQRTKLPEFRACTAQTLIRDERGGLVLVSHGREPIHMKVPAKLVQQIIAEACEPTTT